MSVHEILKKHLSGEKRLKDFSEKELGKFPLDYILNHVNSIELLSVWGKLPSEYTQNRQLQIKLPCFIHYNNFSDVDEVDSPPLSQERCHLCKLNTVQ